MCLKGRGFSHAERKSFSINPNDYETHIELLILYTELGRKDEAVAEAEKILKISPNFSVEAYGEKVSYNDPAQAERDMGHQGYNRSYWEAYVGDYKAHKHRVP